MIKESQICLFSLTMFSRMVIPCGVDTEREREREREMGSLLFSIYCLSTIAEHTYRSKHQKVQL